MPERSKHMKGLRNVVAVVAVLSIVGFGYFPLGLAQEGKSIEQMIAEAKTPGDHEAIAAFYEKEAQDARQKQTQHEKMRNLYTKRYPTKRSAMVTHCDNVVNRYKEMAGDYEDLAQLHKELAAEAQ
jgi:hypothetical protein